MKSLKVLILVGGALALMNWGVWAFVNKLEKAAADMRLPDPQSWDQENLKRGDKGCPTAIFTAPNGNLQQCAQQQEENDTPHQIELLTQPPGYDTIEKAVLVGFEAIAAKPSSQYYEWGGLIVKNAKGKFIALDANTSFGGDHVNIRDPSFLLQGTVVGSYHTHPCIPGHFIEYFSPADLMEPLFFHLTAFMGDFCTGTVHEFLPGDKPDVEHPTDHGHTGGDFFLTKGRIIGQFTTPHALTVVE